MEKSVITLESDSKNDLNQIVFSENGYHLASNCINENSINIWDLRKNEIVKTLNYSNSKINLLDYHKGGNHLCVSGETTVIYNIRNENVYTILEDSENKNISFNTKFISDLNGLVSIDSNGIERIFSSN